MQDTPSVAVHMLDWVVPVALAAIAWFLKKLDASVQELTKVASALGTKQAVTDTRIEEHERRLEKLEDKDC